MLATSYKVIRAFWGMSKKDMKAELREALKEVLPPCYQDDDGNGSGNTPDNNDSGGASSPANLLGETQPVEPYQFASATLDANAMNPMASAVSEIRTQTDVNTGNIDTIVLDLPDCDSLLDPGAINGMNAACIAVGSFEINTF